MAAIPRYVGAGMQRSNFTGGVGGGSTTQGDVIGVHPALIAKVGHGKVQAAVTDALHGSGGSSGSGAPPTSRVDLACMQKQSWMDAIASQPTTTNLKNFFTPAFRAAVSDTSVPPVALGLSGYGHWNAVQQEYLRPYATQDATLSVPADVPAPCGT